MNTQLKEISLVENWREDIVEKRARIKKVITEVKENILW